MAEQAANLCGDHVGLKDVAQENNDQTLPHSAHVYHPVGALGL